LRYGISLEDGLGWPLRGRGRLYDGRLVKHAHLDGWGSLVIEQNRLARHDNQQ
jgi:hypothetical protein